MSSIKNYLNGDKNLFLVNSSAIKRKKIPVLKSEKVCLKRDLTKNSPDYLIRTFFSNPLFSNPYSFKISPQKSLLLRLLFSNVDINLEPQNYAAGHVR
jgi:hypothetical protein